MVEVILILVVFWEVVQIAVLHGQEIFSLEILVSMEMQGKGYREGPDVHAFRMIPGPRLSRPSIAVSSCMPSASKSMKTVEKSLIVP